LKIIVREKVFSPKHFNGWQIFNKCFPSVRGENVLEIGTGVGVTALYLAKQGAKRVIAVDINPHAVKNAKENVVLNNIKNVEVRRSDIFSAIKNDERFNTIYWNTPFMYVPSGYKYRSVLERGLFDPGYKITERFLREGKNFLTIKGRILFGTGDFGDVPRLKKIAKKYRYKIRLIAREKSTEINPVVFELYELKLL
jgi:release factor glutamine methyltransferase